MSNLEKYLTILQSEKASVRYEACEELRVSENLPKSALLALQTATNDNDPLIADAARRALLLHSESEIADQSSLDHIHGSGYITSESDVDSQSREGPTTAQAMETDLTTQSQFKSNSLRAKWAVILLSITVIVGVIAVASDLGEMSLLSRALQGESISMEEAIANDGRQQLIGVLQLSLLILTAIVFLLWIYHANKNLSSLGVKNLRFTPGWAVGNWFIPFLNIFRPPQVMTEIWKASDPRDESGVIWKTATSWRIIDWWWIAYLGSGILGSWASQIDLSTATLQQIITASRLGALSDLVSVVAGILAILIVRDINQRQEEKAKLQSLSAQLL